MGFPVAESQSTPHLSRHTVCLATQPPIQHYSIAPPPSLQMHTPERLRFNLPVDRPYRENSTTPNFKRKLFMQLIVPLCNESKVNDSATEKLLQSGGGGRNFSAFSIITQRFTDHQRAVMPLADAKKTFSILDTNCKSEKESERGSTRMMVCRYSLWMPIALMLFSEMLPPVMMCSKGLLHLFAFCRGPLDTTAPLRNDPCYIPKGSFVAAYRCTPWNFDRCWWLLQRLDGLRASLAQSPSPFRKLSGRAVIPAEGSLLLRTLDLLAFTIIRDINANISHFTDQSGERSANLGWGLFRPTYSP
ncbi:uncharacterized protein BDR25DRAFT_349186 [Lindgomyces ingoldianus]|uniref:Uncharacterized protein n=1 Tax=Lindgomyces ingoldianus TaxID=673940 RepID=A0ACB6RDH6_9PLEO|nr:uncharacterized protein BDR25DRAFT_349186 [Lindgomyces ingoldianus]KAF2477241.1 hypothetical protein BDR25DRAFT_349186 [Lindgomyces ingoldianus]